MSTGQAGAHPDGTLDESVGDQTAQTLRNVMNALAASGATESDILSVRVYLIDVADFGATNEAHAESSASPTLVKPALATLAIFTLLGSWDNLIWPLIAINNEQNFTLQLGLASFLRHPAYRMVLTNGRQCDCHYAVDLGHEGLRRPCPRPPARPAEMLAGGSRVGTPQRSSEKRCRSELPTRGPGNLEVQGQAPTERHLNLERRQESLTRLGASRRTSNQPPSPFWARRHVRVCVRACVSRSSFWT